MNDIDLRNLGSIMGLPLYIDVSSVRDTKVEKGLLSERDIMVLRVRRILEEAVGMPSHKDSDEPIS